MKSKFPGWRTMTGVQRRNAKMHAMFERAAAQGHTTLNSGSPREVSGWPIVHALGYWRYVNHAEKLLTTGFDNRAGLERNADIIRTDPAAIELMRARYAEAFPSKLD